MKATLPTQLLLDAMGHAASVASTKSPNPVLECVALRAERSTGLTLEATDLDVSLRLSLEEAEVEEPGTLVVPAARLLSVVREIESETATLQEVEGTLLLQSGRNSFRIRGEDARSFGELGRFPAAGGARLPGTVLKAMIRRTVFATAKEAGRFALHGVLFRAAGSLLELVATDGRRLARATHPLTTPVDKEVRVIVGSKGLSLLERVVADDGAELSVALQERQVMFQCGRALVISRLIDGTFPAYEDVIPKPSSRSFRVPVAPFATALRRAALLTTRDAISIQVDVTKDLLTLRSRAAEVGEAKVELPVAYDGPAERMGFNPAFLLEALKVMEPEAEVRFEFTSGKTPGKLTDGDDYVYVVMPISLE